MSWFRKKVEPFGLGWRSLVHSDPSELDRAHTRIYTVPFNYHLHLISVSFHITTPALTPGGGSFYPVDHYRANHFISRSQYNIGVGANLDLQYWLVRNANRAAPFGASLWTLGLLCQDIYMYPGDTLKMTMYNAGIGGIQDNVVYHFRQWITS